MLSDKQVSDPDIKIIDFGMAHRFLQGEEYKSMGGTPQYIGKWYGLVFIVLSSSRTNTMRGGFFFPQVRQSPWRWEKVQEVTRSGWEMSGQKEEDKK